MNIIEAWVKVAVEKKILRIKYFSKTKSEVTIRDVEPDYIGYDKKGRVNGLWITRDHLRQTAPRVFYPKRIIEWEVTNRSFTNVNPHCRWKELIPLYKEWKLEKRDFYEEI